jgi:hypothetical protein
MLVLGYNKSTVTVSPGAYAEARKAQTGADECKFLFDNFGDVEGFDSLSDDSKVALCEALAGPSFDASDLAAVGSKRKAPLSSDDTAPPTATATATATATTATTATPTATKKKKAKATVQCITEVVPIPSPLDIKPCAGKVLFKVVSWNVAGLRALLRKDPDTFNDLVAKHDPDVLCIQEHKLQDKNVEGEGEGEENFKKLLDGAGYDAHWAVR